MNEESDKCIKKVLNLAHDLLLLADEGDAVRHDVGCGVLYGTMRDCAYKIRTLAETEFRAHKTRLNSADPSDRPSLGHEVGR